MEKREVRLYYRDPAPVARPLLKGADLGKVGWLLLSAFVALAVPNPDWMQQHECWRA
jgi:hypothetical protein